MDRADRFDRADFEARQPTQPAQPAPAEIAAPKLTWPIPPEKIQRIGETVVARRKGSHRPHKGLDIFAAPGTPVVAAYRGQVLRVVDGRGNANEKLRRAGLFIDIKTDVEFLILRYLHMGQVSVRSGQLVHAGDYIGSVGEARKSGIEHSKPHIHFEVRQTDMNGQAETYGNPIDPLGLLPRLPVLTA